MSFVKTVIKELKFWEECKSYGLGIWQCPKFLFLVMGFVTITAMVLTHLIATRYTEPEFVVVSVVGVAVIIFTIGNMVVHSFEKIAVASRMKTEFISIVSHQLRTPLSSLKWSLDLFLSNRTGKLDVKQLEQARTMKESNDRMIRLVNDLLNATRIEQGGIVLKKEKINLGALIHVLVREAKSFAEANNVSIKVENPRESITVYADKQYISMALESLIDNAIRYIDPRGKVVIRLEKRRGFARVEVQDSGAGIPKGEQRYIFQKVFRSQNIMRHRTEGSGLGLYIARAFIELHHGKMGFTSKEGVGSTFWLELPLK